MGLKWVWKDGRGGLLKISDIAYRHIGYRLSSFWFPAVLCRGMAICIINRPDPGENLGNNQGIQSILDLNFNSGYQALLDSLQSEHRQEIIDQGSIHGVSAFQVSAGAFYNEASGDGTSSGEAYNKDLDSWVECYTKSAWFGDIYALLTKAPGSYVPSPKLLERSYDYLVIRHILWTCRKDMFLPCIPEGKVLTVLREAHDDNGHWGRTGTMARLRGRYYWPHQSQDVDHYISGCLECAKC